MNILPSELFNELWNKYNHKIYYYFRRQFDENTAEDLCQQTYLNAWRYISVYTNREIHKGKSWLFAIAKNVKNDHLRYMSLYSMNFNYGDLFEKEISVEHNIDESINLHKAFDKLSEEDKELLSMAQYLTSREIGSVLGISASATRSRIQKAKEKLKTVLNEFDIR